MLARKIESQIVLPKSTARFLLNENGFKVFKFEICQILQTGDEIRRTVCE